MSSTLIPQTLPLALGTVQFPPGSVLDHIVVTATGTSAGNTQSQNIPPQSAVGTIEVTFSLAPDTYTFSAVGVDASGNDFGAPVTCQRTVTAPTVTLIVPVSIGP